mgnify:FL=1
MKKNLRNILAFAILLVAPLLAAAKNYDIVPAPVEITEGEGTFEIARGAVVGVADKMLLPTAEYLADYMETYLGIPLAEPQLVKKAKNPAVRLLWNKDAGMGEEEYRLCITARDGVVVEAASPAGMFYGVQTLIQLLPSRPGICAILPAVAVHDYPRFAFRAQHLDVSRHYFPVAYIKKMLDYMAFHKMNYFHWHLTDDQGWRIEMKCRPELTAKGAWREGEIEGLYPGKYKELPYGGYYTQEDVKEVVEYAAARHITVIPEIDIPGHCMAVLATYPELGTKPDEEKKCALTWGIFNKFNNVLAPKPATFDFLRDVFTELCSLFPGPYIHLGGDECAPRWWEESEETQQYMRDHGIKTTAALQSHIVNYVVDIVEQNGKTALGWDEVLQEGVSPKCVIVNWRAPENGVRAVKAGHRTVMASARWSYLNVRESARQDEVGPVRVLPMKKVYGYDVVPDSLSAEEATLVMGVESCLWTEYDPTTWKVEYFLFPRLAAVAENGWSAVERKNWDDFVGRMLRQLDRYDLWGIRYSERFLETEDIKRIR